MVNTWWCYVSLLTNLRLDCRRPSVQTRRMLVITDWSFPRRQPIRATSFLFQPYRCSNERDMSASVGSGCKRSGTVAISSTSLAWIANSVNALHRPFAPGAEDGRFFTVHSCRSAFPSSASFLLDMTLELEFTADFIGRGAR